MKSSLAVFVLGACLTLTACNAAPGAANPQTIGTLEPVPADYAGKVNPLGPDSAAAGAEIYKTDCLACHGAQGHGDGPAGTSLHPAPRNLAQLSAVAADDYLYWRISTGRPGTAMPPWRGILAADQIWQVVAYIRTLK